MFIPALGSPAKFGALGLLCLMLAGCSSSPHPTICGGASSGGMCMSPEPLLYASTTSNQLLPFSISNSSGTLTALTAASGPANSGSIANLGFFLMFDDPSTNAVDSYQVSGSGTLTKVQGSPFALGTAAGGPTSILAAPYGFFYATEPNGTIVGFSTPDDGTLTAPVPDSPFQAGTAPAQMAVSTLNPAAPGIAGLYASEQGPSGGILAYTINSSGSLSPVANSPFPTLADWSAGSLLVANSFLYVTLTSNASDTDFGKVAGYAIDSNSGSLTAVPGSPFAVGNSPSAVAVDSSNHLFVMNAGDHTLSAFSIEANGMLTAIGSPVAAGTATGGIALYPPYLYAADTNAGSILIFHIDPSTGTLSSSGSMQVASPPLQLTVVALPTV